MDEMMDYTPDLLSLTDENGVEHQFEIVGEVEVNGCRYVGVTPCGDLGDFESAGELIILKSEYDEILEEEFFSPEEDDEILARVLEELEDVLDAMFEIEE